MRSSALPPALVPVRLASFKLAPFLGAALCLARVAPAENPVGTMTPPTLDRWVYAFNSTPGSKPEVSVFGAILVAGFDDRDAEMLVGFDTASIIPPGRGDDAYAVNALRLRLRVSQGNRFEYDPTPDSVRTSFLTTDPAYVADNDAGKPVEVWGVGYRNGFTAATFQENSPFSPFGFGGPWQNVRNCYPIAFGDSGLPVDVSNQVKDRAEAAGLAIGLASDPVVTPGALVPADTEFTFDLSSLTGPGAAYVRQGLNNGRLMFLVSSLHAASGGPGGGTSTAYPVFYTKENPLAPVLGYAGKLDFDVRVRHTSDFDGSGGTPDGTDISAFFDAWLAGDPRADFDDSGGTPDTSDITEFFRLWLLGL